MIVYNEQLQHFETALKDGDRAFLDHLHGRGFRLRAESACHLLDAIPSFRFTVRDATQVKVVRAFYEGPLKCNERAAEAAMLGRLIEKITGQTCVTSAAYKMGISLIEAWISVSGKSPEFRLLAQQQAAFIKKSSSTGTSGLIELCTRDFGSLEGRQKAQRTSYVFTRSCDAVLGKVAAETRLPPFSMEFESEMDRAKRLCKAYVTASGIHDEAKLLLATLTSWSE